MSQILSTPAKLLALEKNIKYKNVCVHGCKEKHESKLCPLSHRCALNGPKSRVMSHFLNLR